MKYLPATAATAPANILLVIPWSPDFVGGVSTVVRQLRAEWQASGQPVTLAVESWPDQSPRRDGEVVQFRFNITGSGKAWHLLARLPWTLRALIHTAKLLRQERVGSVNFHYPSLSALGVGLLKRWGLFGGRLVLSFHGTDVRAPVGWFEHWAWRALFSASDAITVCSSSLGKRLRDVMGAPASKVQVAYNGVDAQTFSASARDAAVQMPAIPFSSYVVSVGNYIPRKAHRVLLDAFHELQEPGLGLVIAGMDGPERPSLLETAARYGLTSQVLLLCDLVPAQVAALLRKSKLAVQPSLDEPFGLAVIEAAACGAPVAVSGVGGHLEIVEHGRTGWVFPPGDAMACALAMRQMLSEPDECRLRASRLGLEVQDRFTWHRCAGLYRQHLLGNETSAQQEGSRAP